MDPIRAYSHEVYMLRARDKQWSTALEMLEDQNRYLQWHVQHEKAERMKQEAEVVMMRRELGPDKVAALRNRLKAPSVKVCILFCLQCVTMTYSTYKFSAYSPVPYSHPPA